MDGAPVDRQGDHDTAELKGQQSLVFQDFNVNLMQAVLWFEGYEPTSRDILRLAAAKWASRFDGEPTLLPNAAGLPPELPRAIVGSEDGHWKIQVSANRLDLTWDQQLDRAVNWPSDFSEIVNEAVSPFIELDLKLRITRLAFVVRRHLEAREPAKSLAAYFVRGDLRDNKGPLNRPEGFELHAHKKYQPASLPEINSWIRWRSATLTSSGTPVIAVSQDLNTLADRGLTYSDSESRAFFANAPIEADGILRLYLSAPPEN